MITKLLVANRGEITCRIIKTAKRLGIATVAVYSDADAQALHVQLADEAVHIGGSASKDSYLRADKIIDVAKQTGAQAIHPGYGFLSENADFASRCASNELIFVGPPVGAIEAMGSKSAAKTIMEKANVPLVPGYHGDDQSEQLLLKSAREIGFPVLLKAAAGGGGKGMRQVHSESEFNQALGAAKREAMASFNDDIMLVEKYLTQPRHVEIQVFCDEHGNGVYLFERDCSVQRRHQKVIEEAPAPGMSASLRQEMGEAALKAAKAIQYVGAGTVEFLLDHDGAFYFMEMNTRLQVEHPVTEMITGQDLVEWQLRVASGEPLPLAQDELKIHGHAFEARIYAEDPNNEFLPATGTLSTLRPPEENRYVRVDTGVVEGDSVSVFYDPMIAKLIVWDEDRDKALERLGIALRDYHIHGVVTNIEFLYNIATFPAFKAADFTTRFIEQHYDKLFSTSLSDNDELVPFAALSVLLKQHNAHTRSGWRSPALIFDGWRANERHTQHITLSMQGEDELDIIAQYAPKHRLDTWKITVNDQTYFCSGELNDGQLDATIDGHRQRLTVANVDNHYHLFGEKSSLQFTQVLPDLGIDTEQDSAGGLTAPMNGTIVSLLVETNTTVEKGTPLVIMEAMKMEHTIKAPAAGSVAEFYFSEGQLVDGGAALLDFNADE
ncbi:acetyl/propionyl/methylcrotonyl-CoA carboxylase subunit alpha [Alteromonas oceanisediminis]|uniref:acetyl/propionyl/methylcrotonyl-CoA carboxylase subunit alpha n=1 Tax=Alteromonas oceanisediminis TaxID=2836180 RepID=UPI001BDA0876|nr:acetyl/propionyl/methylcrotonyl-CoA carboxylase subunit alpha [Alteromonas oceanisediminis]MBT0587242.1 acetyl/propionyl/methylcrotonyl-CoA carboxylase subunit alpha [Alteromonas oceanisediminis]